MNQNTIHLDDEGLAPNPLYVFQMIFGLPFIIIPLFFVLMPLEYFFEEPSLELLLFVIGMIIFTTPFYLVGGFLVMSGYYMVLGEPLPEIGKRKEKRKLSRESRIFGGGRSLRGPIILTLLFLPFLIMSPSMTIYGFGLLISANYEGCFLMPIGLLFTVVLYGLVSTALTKRTLEINHPLGKIYYEETLFGRIKSRKIKLISECLEIREFGKETKKQILFGESDDGRWELDIGTMIQTNDLNCNEISEVIGIPFRREYPDWYFE